jgi:RNA-directed DNA polymerase
MNGDEKSDPAIVAVKPANEPWQPGKEWVEPRAGAEGNARDSHGVRARNRAAPSSGIDRVRKAAQERKAEKFTTLPHHIDAPLLANIYLHHVYDLWAEQWRRRHAHGTMIVVRYADDTVVGFEHRADAERFLADLRIRMAEFDLESHPDKTGLIEFGGHAASDRAERGDGKPETFNFLGFTHICSRSRRGGFQLARHTRRDRKQAKLLEITEDLRRRWHQDVAEQGRWLGSVVRGFFAYHAIPTNFRALSAFRHHVVELWRRALRGRSQKDRTSWTDMDRLANRWLPKPRISHPWPSVRFRVKHPRWEPYAGIPPVRFCAGGAQ